MLPVSPRNTHITHAVLCEQCAVSLSLSRAANVILGRSWLYLDTRPPWAGEKVDSLDRTPKGCVAGLYRQKVRRGRKKAQVGLCNNAVHCPTKNENPSLCLFCFFFFVDLVVFLLHRFFPGPLFDRFLYTSPSLSIPSLPLRAASILLFFSWDGSNSYRESFEDTLIRILSTQLLSTTA